MVIKNFGYDDDLFDDNFQNLKQQDVSPVVSGQK